MKIKQQQNKGLEQFVDVRCDMSVNENILPINSVVRLIDEHHSDISLTFLLNKVLKDHFTSGTVPSLDSLAVIQTSANIKTDRPHELSGHKLYGEYSKYANNFNKSCPPIVLLHPSIYGNVQPERDELYQVDGMHRVVSAIVAGVQQLETYIIVRRSDIHKLLSEISKRQISLQRDGCTWFPNYQQIKEVGLTGQRVQYPRYPDIYDFSVLAGKTVVDFGGNTGQAAVEAYFNNAARVYNMDVQKCAVDTSDKIFKILGMRNCTSHTIDFNDSNFERDVLDICPNGWDWCIFQAIYRTKEIIDIKKNFQFIVENTREGIMFEGNGEPTIDTDEFYHNIFKPFNFSKITGRGLCQKRPVYIINK